MTVAAITRPPRAVPYASAREQLDDHVTILRQWIRATQEGGLATVGRDRSGE